MKTLKKLFLSTVILCVPFSLLSQNYITVDHNGTPSLYTDMQTAIDGAQSGDYIYVPGRAYNLSSPLIIDKEVHIIGAGHYPDSTEATNTTNFTGAIYITGAADNTSISGIRISDDLLIGYSGSGWQSADNIVISRCRIAGKTYLSMYSDNIYLFENVFEEFVMGNSDGENVVFSKNIFESYIECFNNSVFKNNIFIFAYNNCGGANDCDAVLGGSSAHCIIGCLFENNIFFDHYPLKSKDHNNWIKYVQSGTFNNNLFIYNQYFPYATNSGTNNIVNQDQGSIFVNQSGNSFSYSHDYHLKPTCPGINAGTDGTDIGIYGTGEPYKEGAVPANPHIRSKAITVENNVIHVNVKVAAQER